MTTRLPLFDELPASLTLVRHAESLGNVASRRAYEAKRDDFTLDVRDADIDLSANGIRQANALGAWFAGLPAEHRPTTVLSSPYRRALHTAERTLGDSGLPLIVDERLRERDLGAFDGLTVHGIRARYAAVADRRRRVGKFYHRPPEGESWAEVVLRLRSLLADLRRGFGDARIWVFTHQAVIMSLRYVLEGISEPDLMELDRRVTIGNASLTTYERRGDRLELTAFADDTVVRESVAEPTQEPPVAASGRAAR
jgi:broad specificity phosphatase PhoE